VPRLPLGSCLIRFQVSLGIRPRWVTAAARPGWFGCSGVLRRCSDHAPHYRKIAVALTAAVACRGGPAAPAGRACEPHVANVRYDVPDTGGPWKPVLLARIAAAPDTQVVPVDYYLDSLSTTADSLAIVAHGGRPDWYWVGHGVTLLPVDMPAGGIRRFLADEPLGYVRRATIPLGGCPLAARPAR